jgi:hypothetical protein
MGVWNTALVHFLMDAPLGLRMKLQIPLGSRVKLYSHPGFKMKPHTPRVLRIKPHAPTALIMKPHAPPMSQNKISRTRFQWSLARYLKLRAVVQCKQEIQELCTGLGSFCRYVKHISPSPLRGSTHPRFKTAGLGSRAAPASCGWLYSAVTPVLYGSRIC